MVLIVNTWRVRCGDKTALNDILRQSGPEGPALLRQRISTPLFPEAPRRKRLKPADAIKQVRAAATDFMALATSLDAFGEEPDRDQPVHPRLITRRQMHRATADRAEGSLGAWKPRAIASVLVSLWPSRSRWMNCPPVICRVLSVAMAIRALRPG